MGRLIRILPSFMGVSHTLVCFETQVSSSELREHDIVFEHHGDSYHPIFDAGALRMFYERLMLGQSFPNTMVLTRWWRIDQIMAAALFFTPSLVLSPECTALVNSIDMVDRLGSPALAHIPHEHKMLIGAIRSIATPNIPDPANYPVLTSCATLITQYIEQGVVPSVSYVSDYKVVATEGSVVAFTSSGWAWDRVWMEGALCGLWVKNDDVLEVRVKSELVTPPLERLNMPDFLPGSECLLGTGDHNNVFRLLVERFNC